MRRSGDWIEPDWTAPRGVRALCTTRSGGVSLPPFDSLNLGDHVRDDPARVAANRERLRQHMAPCRPVFLQQVHGTTSLQLTADTPDGIVADGCVALAGSGVAATIMVADCLPVLLALRSGEAVAAAHAGWRGLAGGVLEATVQALRAVARADSEPGPEVVAWLGPCIGPTAFEVGPEVREAFLAGQALASAGYSIEEVEGCFSAAASGKYLADLSALARLRLRSVGIAEISGNDSTAAWCTVSQPSVFFSHRRDAARLGSTGRMAASVWVD